MAVTHEVKCWSEYFDAISRKEKNFDVRRDDRGYQKGDTLTLQKYDSKKFRFIIHSSGGIITMDRKIKYVLTGGQFGIEPGYVVLGF